MKAIISKSIMLLTIIILLAENNNGSEAEIIKNSEPL